MTSDKLSALLSGLSALLILIAAFFQWWTPTVDGGLITRGWVKALLSVCIVILIVAMGLLLFD